jgi:hypothetical protein
MVLSDLKGGNIDRSQLVTFLYKFLGSSVFVQDKGEFGLIEVNAKDDLGVERVGCV